MTGETALHCTAFAGSRRIAAGSLDVVARAVKAFLARDRTASALVFDDATGRQIDLDLRGTDEEAVQRLADHPLARRGEAKEAEPRGPGRPKLGVVAREITLLPRHWEWLNAQPGGASVALRKLVDEARQSHAGRDRRRAAQEATYRLMSALAGDAPGYEDALRALFGGDRAAFDASIGTWPGDVCAYVARLAEAAFASAAPDRDDRLG